jgi:hypothetical protein
MRRNSGKDEGRDNFLDPTMKEHERARGKSGAAILDTRPVGDPLNTQPAPRSTGMGSHARKTGGKGSSR